uniref:Uncharacterized protein n=1 Tax=Anopheles atroparvus TaxID=41427 RepID=A0AAG5DI37_ANOAO
QIALLADECVQHAERLLRRHDVLLQPEQPAGHRLQALHLAARLLREVLLVAPVLHRYVRAPVGRLLHQQLLDDLARDDVLDLHVEFLRQVVRDVAERHDRGAVVLALRVQRLLEALDDLREDVYGRLIRTARTGIAKRGKCPGSTASATTTAGSTTDTRLSVDKHAANGVLRLLWRASNRKLLAKWGQFLQDTRVRLDQCLVAAQVRERFQHVRCRVRFVERQQPDHVTQDLVVLEVRTEHVCQHGQQLEASLAGGLARQPDLLDHLRATLHALEDQLDQHTDRLLVHHHRGDALEQHLDRVVVAVGHDRLAELLQHDRHRVGALLARHVPLQDRLHLHDQLRLLAHLGGELEQELLRLHRIGQLLGDVGALDGQLLLQRRRQLLQPVQLDPVGDTAAHLQLVLLQLDERLRRVIIDGAEQLVQLLHALLGRQLVRHQAGNEQPLHQQPILDAGHVVPVQDLVLDPLDGALRRLRHVRVAEVLLVDHRQPVHRLLADLVLLVERPLLDELEQVLRL